MALKGMGRLAIVAGLALPLLLGACASQDAAKQAQDTANAAKAQADAASATAQQALQAANAANQAAQAATAKADQDASDIQALNQKTDQMFQKSLRK